MPARKRKTDPDCGMDKGFGFCRPGGADDAAEVALIGPAKIATGSLVDRTVEFAPAHGGDVGASPGFRDLHGFRRRYRSAGPGEIDPICFHSDTPGAVDLGRAVCDALTAAGARIAART